MSKLVTETDRQQKRRAILDAAATEIARHGYDRANTNTIAERAGIGHGTLYLYFASKDEVLDAIGSLIDDAVRSCLESELSWQDRLSTLSRAFVALADEHRDFFRIHVSALHEVNRDMGTPMTRWLSTSVQRLADAFQEAMAGGPLMPMPAETLATLLRRGLIPLLPA